jgi:hypothetical protein
MKPMKKSICLLCGLFIFISSSFSSNKEFTDLMHKAKHRIELVTPGIFSPEIIKTIQELSSKQIRIRILTDCTFLGAPENLIDLLRDSMVSIRIIPEKLAIGHNILIIDEKETLFGGSHLKDGDSIFPKPVTLEKKPKNQNHSAQFQAIWTSINPQQSNLLLHDASFFIDTDTVSTKGNQKTDTSYNRQNRTTTTNNHPFPFAASKNSRSYHKSDSPFTKRIKKENLIFFATEEEAVKSGRKPASNF